MLFILVRDTGIGISESVIPSIFKPFWQADGINHIGTGLGLTICKRLCQYLGGDIKVESEVKKGTTVKIKIPVKVMEQSKLGSAALFNEGNSGEVLSVEKFTFSDVSEFILNINEEDRAKITECLEFQRLDKICNVESLITDKKIMRDPRFKLLRKAAEDFDYLFLSKVHKSLNSNN